MITIASLCWLCQQPLSLASHGICSLCVRQLQRVTPCCCPRCGLPSQHRHLPCGRCLLHPPMWQSLIFVSDYIPPLRELVWRFKYQGDTRLARPLARLILLQCLARFRTGSLPRPQQLIAVPLHRQRLCKRGYNQSQLLASHLAHWLGCHYQGNTLTRRRNTLPQQGLNKRQRQNNLQQAFFCQTSLAGQHLALIDDVITTGSTLSAISQLLLNNGALSIQVWCLCRTL
jgi:ComF family protein